MSTPFVVFLTTMKRDFFDKLGVSIWSAADAKFWRMQQLLK
jgi:hypothetical protein